MDPSDQHIAPRLSGHCPPRRSSESLADYAQRAGTYYRAFRRQLLQECYTERQARLLSPQSDDGNNDEDTAQLIEYLENAIYWDERPGEYFNYEYPVQHIEYDGPIGSLTDNEDDDIPYGIRPEEREWLEYLAQHRRNGSLDSETSQAAATTGHKRKEAPEEDSDVQAPAKRTRVSTRAGTLRAAASGHKRKEIPEEDSHTQAPAKRTRVGTRPDTLLAATSGRKRKEVREDISDLQAPEKRTKVGTRAETLRAAAQGHKRKRAQEEGGDLATRSQAITKKRRTDTRPQPAVKQPGGKRKQDSDEQQTSQEEEGPEAKRRRAGKDTQPLQLQTSASSGPSPEKSATNPGERKPDSVSAVKEISPRPKHTSRVTRAQRRLLSGKDTQLFQLGQRGELDVQVIASDKDTPKDTAGKLRSARTGPETGAGARSGIKSGRQNKRGRKGRC
ncbi:hypothetical protein VPNG_03595 [Cytospora leucostoma]|uniref:Uncharacterized protein n=1 Tax=Cytospora leucostoma TaxID=1230097 RepID=A0A423XCZ2_9PEZI|nr:hypothetical protein VPNG_03595 [Cytospora leucostoma]